MGDDGCCKACCRKLFPPNGFCGCCKPPQVQKQIDTQTHVLQDVKKTNTPYGYIEIFPGVRTSNNGYTCPMLSVQLYRRSENTVFSKEDTRTLTVDSKKRKIHEGPEKKTATAEGTSEVEILMIPLEDITQISCKGETKTSINADIESHIEPQYATSENCWDRCCAAILSCCHQIYEFCCCCCQKTSKVEALVHTEEIIRVDPTRSADFKVERLSPPPEDECCCSEFCDNCCRCWCCRKQKITGFIKRTKTVSKEEAKRVITITIEYSKYSNLDTPTNTRLLSEFDRTNFELRKREAEILCRTVMQLKGMRNNYPSADELEKILDLPYNRTFGVIYEEPILQLTNDSMTSITTDSRTQRILPASQRLAIEPRKISTSEQRRKVNNRVKEED